MSTVNSFYCVLLLFLLTCSVNETSRTFHKNSIIEKKKATPTPIPNTMKTPLTFVMFHESAAGVPASSSSYKVKKFQFLIFKFKYMKIHNLHLHHISPPPLPSSTISYKVLSAFHLLAILVLLCLLHLNMGNLQETTYRTLIL